jgi:hypothetical protein
MTSNDGLCRREDRRLAHRQQQRGHEGRQVSQVVPVWRLSDLKLLKTLQALRSRD